MNLVILHRRRLQQIAPELDSFSFDTLSDTDNNAFLIRRESDNVEAAFTYSEITDGTYLTWLNGAYGAIVEWYGTGADKMHQDEDIYQMRLDPSGFIDDYDETQNIGMYNAIDMSQDWVVTFIAGEEVNSANQRLSFGIRGAGSLLIGVELDSRGRCYTAIDILGTIDPTHSFYFTNNSDFKLFSFSKIGGVLEVRLNNSVMPNDGPAISLVTSSIPENGAVLGSRQWPGSSVGKTNQYKHLGFKAGDLSSFDLSAHNQAIMTKYNIV